MKEVFAELIKGVEENKDADKDGDSGWTRIIAYEYELGLKDQAFEHFAKMFVKLKDSEKGKQPDAIDRWPLHALFPNREWGPGPSAADLWWAFLRGKFPNEDETATLKRMRGILDTRKPGEEFVTLIRDAEQSALKLEGGERDVWLRILAHTCQAADRNDLAQGFLEKAAEKGASDQSLSQTG